MKALKKCTCFFLILSMILSAFLGMPRPVKADEGDLISCSEQEAYEKGIDYYKVWYICNKGNSADLMWGSKNNLPASSLIEKTRNTLFICNEIDQWRLMTFNLEDLMDHSAKEITYCEDILYDLVSGQETAISDGVSFIGDVTKAAKNTKMGTWKKVTDEFKREYNMDLTELTKREDLTIEQMGKLANSLQPAFDYDKLSKTFKFGSKVTKVLNAASTVGDYVDGLLRLKILLGETSDKSSILRRMCNYTENDAYKTALDNYASYLKGSITDEQAAGIYTETYVRTDVTRHVGEFVWDALLKKNELFAGVQIAETTAKTSETLANILTGQSDKYSAYEKMEVCHDMEHTLWKVLDEIMVDVDRGSVDAAQEFLVGYSMLQAMYELCYDYTAKYYTQCYSEGALNQIFFDFNPVFWINPTTNHEKLDKIVGGIQYTRTVVSDLFDADYSNAEEAWKAMVQKNDPELPAPELTLKKPVNPEKSRQDYEDHVEDFRLYMEKDRRLSSDKEVFGNLVVAGSTLDLNGQHLTVHGDVILQNGSLNVNGILDVYGNVYDTDDYYTSSITITGGSHLRVNGDMTLMRHYIFLQGGVLQVGGNLTIAERAMGYDVGLEVDNSGIVEIRGDYTSTQHAVRGISGSMSVGGSFIQADYMNNGCNDAFAVSLTGSKDIKVKNLKGGILNIENAASRKITMEETVAPYELKSAEAGGAAACLTVTPRNLSLAGRLQLDVTVEGDTGLAGGLYLNGHTLTVKGNAYHSGSNSNAVNIDKGTLDIKGNYGIAYWEDGAYKPLSYVSLRMSNPEDHIIVGGNLTVNVQEIFSLVYNDLSDGILEVKGNFSQTGKADGFNATGNHTTILNGSKLQRVNMEGYPSSKFNKLLLTQYEENYRFNPDPCWNEMSLYCDHASTIVKNKVEVTCMEDGYTGDTYCADCDELLAKGSVVEAEGHKAVAMQNVEATCSREGQSGGRQCSVCGKITKEPTRLPRLSHQSQDVEEMSATCTEDGCTAGRKCTICNEVLNGMESIPATGHKSKTVVKKATLTANGSSQKVCGVCQEALSTKTTIYRPDKMKLSKIKFIYSGSAQKPVITVTNSKGNTIANSNYTLKYSGECKNPGKYTVTLTFKGNFTGTMTGSFTIVPKSTTLSSLTPVSKGFIAKWKKQASQTTGYQLQYATGSAFKNPKNVAITKTATLSKKVTGLKAKKKYYVRIRTYKTVSGTKYYSPWSASKAVTTK